jgi:hypothetical protein
MITKTDNCADVHELCISKEEFERKEQRRESIYSGQIYNRRVSIMYCLINKYRSVLLGLKSRARSASGFRPA